MWLLLYDRSTKQLQSLPLASLSVRLTENVPSSGVLCSMTQGYLSPTQVPLSLAPEKSIFFLVPHDSIISARFPEFL